MWTKKVEYSTDDGVTWIDLGHIRADGSEGSAEAAAEETSAGAELYAGTDEQLTVQVPDKTKYSALATAMKDDTIQGNIQLRTTDADGTVNAATEGWSVIVQDPKNFAPRTRSPFQARFRRTTV